MAQRLLPFAYASPNGVLLWAGVVQCPEECLAARRLAGTFEGIAYAKRLKAMRPAEAAAEMAGMFCLLADEES